MRVAFRWNGRIIGRGRREAETTSRSKQKKPPSLTQQIVDEEGLDEVRNFAIVPNLFADVVHGGHAAVP
jgi:hypothetical protein